MTTQDNNEAASAPANEAECRKACDICFDEVGNEWPCVKAKTGKFAASASQSSTPVPREGGPDEAKSESSDLAHVARQRQESALPTQAGEMNQYWLTADGVADVFVKLSEATTYGAQQREAGRLEMAEKVTMLERTLAVAQTALNAALARQPVSEGLTKPVPMILHCPACGLQHIDAPDERTEGWANPPHRSHLCHGCGHIWRPADVPTEGVATIQTRGSNDSAAPPAKAEGMSAIIPDWKPCNPACDYEDPHGGMHDFRNANCSCDQAKASVARQRAAILAQQAEGERP